MGYISNSIWIDILNTYYGLMLQDIQTSKAQTTPVLKTSAYMVGRGKKLDT